ncbi:MAG: helix-turn-helix transcriptional regulator [Eubacterium sp.]|nr:helix-turn-helix transcriptional regulator [Eubacterium sp.]
MNWDEYKKQIRETDSFGKELIDEAEEEARIISAMISQRNELGLTQRELATICNIPQSSVARIESSATTPRLDTIIKICKCLGLRISVSPIIES